MAHVMVSTIKQYNVYLLIQHEADQMCTHVHACALGAVYMQTQQPHAHE